MSMFERFVSTPQVADVLGDHSLVAAMLRFEAALARAQASVDLIPTGVAQSIVGTCKVELFDVPKLARECERERCLATPLLNSLRETVALFNPQASQCVNFGCSTQNVVDNAMALLTQDALTLITADVYKSITLLHTLAAQHTASPMLARQQLKPVAVTSAGLICLQWAAPLQRTLQRLQPLATQALTIALGDLTGTGAALKGKGTLVASLMARELKLDAPAHGHVQRDLWLALGCELGLLTASLGKLATDVSLLSQCEIAEASSAADACMVALAAAQRVPQRVATMLAGMAQEGGMGQWQAGLVEWVALLRCAHAAARNVLQLLSSLRLDADRMLANLEAHRASMGPHEAAQAFAAKLAEHAAAQVRAQLQAQQPSISATV